MKKTNLLFTTLLASVFALNSFAQKVDTVSVYSKKMDKEIKNLVITPKSYDEANATNFPVLYLLHGYSGNYGSWYSLKPELPEIASQYNFIIVCPDGENSWYWDSPVNEKSQFDTFVSKELVEYIDKNYKTKPSREGRAITGLSMGGHGGLWLAITHPDVYGACGSMSGGVDIRMFTTSWEMKKLIGDYDANKDVWDSRTVMTQLDKIKPNSLKIIIDCGTEDFFFDVNESLHRNMLDLKIQHDYITRPGKHDRDYWNNAIDTQVLFFSKFFNSAK